MNKPPRGGKTGRQRPAVRADITHTRRKTTDQHRTEDTWRINRETNKEGNEGDTGGATETIMRWQDGRGQTIDRKKAHGTTQTQQKPCAYNDTVSSGGHPRHTAKDRDRTPSLRSGFQTLPSLKRKTKSPGGRWPGGGAGWQARPVWRNTQSWSPPGRSSHSEKDEDLHGGAEDHHSWTDGREGPHGGSGVAGVHHMGARGAEDHHGGADS